MMLSQTAAAIGATRLQRLVACNGLSGRDAM
jgi:hypothetical protein